MDSYQEFIAKSRYARWIEEINEREDWGDTVRRYTSYMHGQAGKHGIKIDEYPWDEIYNAIYNLEVMPSMRCLMTAGPALDRDNVAGYNCAYAPIDNVRFFDEMVYILMCGVGVGFSVEDRYISKLPQVADEFNESTETITVSDTKRGWAIGVRQLIHSLYQGGVPDWDFSKIRPAGTKLKTFGGRASGPEPLERLFRFSIDLFRRAAGRKLTSLECHDLACYIAMVVEAGGVRRSATISLSDPGDWQLAGAKSGNWRDTNQQRTMANNSAVYVARPPLHTFMKEGLSLYDSHSGERGFISRAAGQSQAARNGRRDATYDFGVNPCAEILLRPNQFCNLSEAVVRAGDSFKDLKRKVRIATIIGTIQSTLTDFRYIRPIWKHNTEEERLLGVSLTGIFDHEILGSTAAEGWLWDLKEVAIETNKEWADRLGIQQSTAITTVKPSGTVSQLVDSASGIHPRYAHHYIRRVRISANDPMGEFMQAQGVPCEEAEGAPETLVFSFPIAAPEGALTTADVDPLDHLDLWKIYQDNWCEHKPSVTISYTDKSYIDVMGWLWKNFDECSGISLLPFEEHIYKQAPYEEITYEQYKELKAAMPESIDWTKLSDFEKEDTTTGAQTLACVSGVCEIVDLA
jgi:ribonucleoside-diphosphate reductase alpha chain